MTFALRMNGDVIAEVDEQVLGVRLMSARGQAAAMGIGVDEGVIDIVLDTVAPGGPPRLDQIEALAVAQMRQRAEEGVVVGVPPDSMRTVEGSVRAGQGLHLETLRPGGVNREEQQTTVNAHPIRDLFDGLDAGDSDTRTARIEAFSQHGDVDRAIKENQPGGNGSGSAVSGLSRSPQSEPLAQDTTTGAAGSTESSPQPGDTSPTAQDTVSQQQASGDLNLNLGRTDPVSPTKAQGRRVKDSPQA